jgi:hypothetical protein
MTTRTVTLRTILVALAGLVTMAAGCHNEIAERRLRDRDQHLRETVRDYQQFEQERPAHLRNIGEHIQNQHESDVAKSQRDVKEVGERINDEFKRWRDRQDDYRREIEAKLKGNPKKIDETWPEVLF